MSSGLSNVPVTSRAILNIIFGPFLHKFVIIFFEDELVYSNTLEDHSIHLQKILTLWLATHYLLIFPSVFLPRILLNI